MNQITQLILSYGGLFLFVAGFAEQSGLPFPGALWLLAAGALALSLMAPATASAEHKHRRHHWNFGVSVGPTYSPGYTYSPYYGTGITNGYYDRWGYFHPYAPSYNYSYGFYDRWGRWHPY